MLSLLAACGGGSDSAAPAATPLPEVAWASPAVFVTPGASSKSFALTMCEREIDNDDEEVEQLLYKASLQIASNGDVSIVASTTETATATTVWSMAFADAQNASWSVSGNTQTPTYSLYMSSNGRSGNKSLNVYRQQISETEFAYYVRTYDYDNNADTSIEIECSLTGKLELQVNADQARAAKNLGTAAGVTTYDDYSIDGRIEGGNAFWQQNDYESAPQDKYNFMRFNLGTGELSSSNANTGTYAAISLSLPSGTSSYGVYGETVSRNNYTFDYKEAKSICLGFESMQAGFGLSVTAFGNKFYPSNSRFFVSRGLETPQGLGGEGCGFED